jgi:hypothetical protein
MEGSEPLLVPGHALKARAERALHSAIGLAALGGARGGANKGGHYGLERTCT